MTDRIQGFIVTLDRDIREDDVEPVLNAIRMIQRVASVEPIVAHPEDHCARARVRAEVQRDIYEAISRIFRDSGRE